MFVIFHPGVSYKPSILTPNATSPKDHHAPTAQSMSRLSVPRVQDHMLSSER